MAWILALVIATLVLLWPLYLLGLVFWRYRNNKKYPITEEELSHYLCESERRHETKVRKQWLLSYTFLTLLLILLSVVAWWCSPEELRPALLLGDGVKKGGLVDNMFRELLVFLIGYYFAYRRRGTIWLSLSIMTAPIAILVILFVGWMFLPMLGWGVLLFSPVLCLEIWLWVTCIRLRKVNVLRRSLIKLAREKKYFQKATVLAT